MNVASKDLCLELYRLSGWYVKSPHNYCVDKSGNEAPWSEDTETIPAYDFGYLLRRLQQNDIQVQFHSDTKRWSAFSPIEKNPHLSMPFADTPEDAACKLAIELFKQGILK